MSIISKKNFIQYVFHIILIPSLTLLNILMVSSLLVLCNFEPPLVFLDLIYLNLLQNYLIPLYYSNYYYYYYDYFDSLSYF